MENKPSPPKSPEDGLGFGLAVEPAESVKSEVIPEPFNEPVQKSGRGRPKKQ